MSQTILTGVVGPHATESLPGSVDLPAGSLIELMGHYSMFVAGAMDAPQTGFLQAVVKRDGRNLVIVGQKDLTVTPSLGNAVQFEVVSGDLRVAVNNHNNEYDCLARVTVSATAMAS